MIRSAVYPISVALLLASAASFGAPCQGRGTVVFFGNGMFNSHRDAEDGRKRLADLLTDVGMGTHGKELLTQLAYKRSEPLLEQLANVVAQKGVTEFENFWAWLGSLENAPLWFQAVVREKTAEFFKRGSQHFDDLQEHFESYATAIRKGYNVVLVSHSQGNFYANQAMRKLASYTDASLTGSIDEKRGKNPNFPAFYDLFSNVQVATPVSATVHSSPWSTFRDDQVISVVREFAGALPANLQRAGVGFPPQGDFLGHGFTKAYLRVSESQAKILADIRAAFAALRYSVAYFQPAVILEHSEPSSGSATIDLSFDVFAPGGGAYPGGHDEERPKADAQVQKEFVNCFDLKPGDSLITAETIVDGAAQYDFHYIAWSEGGLDRRNEKPIDVRFTAKRGILRWEVGVIHTRGAPGGKEPLEVLVEIYPRPKPKRTG